MTGSRDADGPDRRAADGPTRRTPADPNDHRAADTSTGRRAADGTTGPIRVLLADDEELIRAGVAALLELEPDITVVAQAGDGRAAVEAARAHRPDVAVVDLQMPGADGMAVTRELATAVPDCAVVILTGHGRPPHLQQALAAGAAGFVPKGSPGAVLADVVRRVRAGGRYVDPQLAADALAAPPCPLTPRELEVLRAAGPDAPVATVGRRLHLSAGTVRNHLAAIVTKLNATSRSDAHRIALDRGWLT